jgi:type II secretory pathway pseudopilin PulG
MTTAIRKERHSEQGMSLLVVMGMMAVFAIAMLAVAPSIQQEVQREKELEAIQRGEEIADAVRQYVDSRGRLPNSMDDLLEGLPFGTKKRQILRASAAIDPLSADGKWRLIQADPQVLARFARRVQSFNNGLLPGNPSQRLNQYSLIIVNAVNTGTDDDDPLNDDEADTDFEITTDNVPFIGVASQSKGKSVVAYYGIERHSGWIFTPLFRGSNGSNIIRQPGTRTRGTLVQ